MIVGQVAAIEIETYAAVVHKRFKLFEGEIALRACAEFLAVHPRPREVTFVCFGRRDHEVYRAALARFERET